MEGPPNGRPMAVSTATPLHARGRHRSPAAGRIDPSPSDPSPYLQETEEGSGGIAHLYILFPMTLLYLRKHHGDEMPLIFFFFLFVLWNDKMKRNLTLSLNNKTVPTTTGDA